MTFTLIFDLDLEKFAQVQKIWKHQLRKTCEICLDIMHRASSIVGINGQGQGRAKGQIQSIGYNFASNSHRDLILASNFSL